ncbi:hypothetical protein [Oryzifoliimicrobium ureilyticus]|uniref:hypothetical protein n=1 Tax=Oryzifoliimicrobium ureilyticus TaxID=3113724 RepID=UPI0030764098
MIRNTPSSIGRLSLFILAMTAATSALAADYMCENVATTRKMPGPSAAGALPSSGSLTLKVHIDETAPARSTLEWSGDPNVDGISEWPADAKLIKANGTIAATASSVKGDLGSVVTITIDAKGALRITESSLVPLGVVYDVTEGKCHKIGI